MATQQLSEENLLEIANTSVHSTPAMTGARSKFKYLGLGALAFGIMTQVFASEQGSQQLSAACDLLGTVYKGEGASKFVLNVQIATQTAQTQVPPLPRSLVPKSQQEFHPAASDYVGMQVVILRLVQAKSDHLDKFTAAEVAAIEKLHTDWLGGEYSSWGSLLDWAKDTKKKGNLRPHPKSWSRGSGFLVLDGDMDVRERGTFKWLSCPWPR